MRKARCISRLLVLTALTQLVAGCRSLSLGAPEIPAAELANQAPSMIVIVADLQMHLRDDTYRYDRARAADGRNVFSVALWQLDRLERAHALSGQRDDNAAAVIDYAKARALERLRRYPDAVQAYQRVGDRGSVLAEAAVEAAHVISRFGRHSGALPETFASPEQELEVLDSRIEKWRELASEYRGSSYEPLALEELEAWEMLRVEWFAHRGTPGRAVEAAERLAERHHRSKLFARHLLRVGDLYADAARGEYLRFRANAAPFDALRYERALDRALAAYELAAEQRRPALRVEADGRIAALLALHRGVRAHAP